MENSSLKIQKAKSEDFKDIQRLHCNLLKLEKKYCPTIDTDWSFSKDGITHFNECIKDKDFFTLVCRDKEKVVGFLTGSFKGKYPIRSIVLAELNHIYIDPKYRKNGIGLKMSELFRDWAKEKGATEIDVGTHMGNKKAINFYKKLGFNGYGLTLIKKI